MGQDHLDRHFKTSLATHKVSIDKELLWSDIQYKRSRKKIGILLCITAAAATLLSVILLVPNSPVNENTVAYPELEGKESPEFKTERKAQLSADKNIAHQESIAASPTLDENNSEISSNLNLNPKQSENLAEPTSILNTDTKSSGSEFKSYPDLNYSELDSDAAQADSRDTDTKNAESSILSDEHLENSRAATAEILLLETAEKIEAIQDFNTVEYVRNSEEIFLKTTDCPDFGKKKARIFLEAYTMLDYIQNDYTAGIDSEEYLAERKRTQSYRPSYRAGLQFKYLFDNGLFIKSGIEYARARERFRYRRETIRTEIRPDQVISVTIDMNGDTTVILGNAPVTIIETKNWRVSNSYTSLDIPISLGYQMDRGPWFYSIELGVLYNLNFGFSGMILDTSGEPIEADSWFRNSVPLSYNAAFSIGYRLNESLSFTVRTGLRGHTGNINSSLNPIDQKFRSIGTGIGIEYEF